MYLINYYNIAGILCQIIEKNSHHEKRSRDLGATGRVTHYVLLMCYTLRSVSYLYPTYLSQTHKEEKHKR